MKSIRYIAAAALCCIMLGICGCSQDHVNSEISSGGSAENVYSDESKGVASAFGMPPEIETKTESPDITYLGTRDIAKLPEVSMYSESTHGSVNIEFVSNSAYENRLSEMISSDMSPDLTDKRENTFPYLISKNIYEDLTPYMDTAAPQWSGYAGYIEHYAFKNGHYFYPTSVRISPELLVYDKTKFVLFNIPDPEKLLEKNEWTWENFLYCAKTFTDMEGTSVYACGTNIADNMLSSTGMSTVCTDPNSKPAFGMATYNFQNVIDFFEEGFFDQQMTDTSPLTSSHAAFMSADEETIGKLRKTSFTLGIVPYPCWEEKDTYFVKAVTDGYLVPKGAKNVKNAASFINCSRLANSSDEQVRLEKHAMKEQGLLISDIEWLNTIRSLDDLTPVISDVYCLDERSNSIIQNNLLAVDRLRYGENNFMGTDSVVLELEKIGALMDN